MKNVVFFDIDGTLWDNQMQIPPSTKEAIARLRELGSYAFLCSGRSRAAIRSEKLLALGFDGVLAGCGTHVEFGEELIYERLLEESAVRELIEVLDAYQMPAILEGPEYLYVHRTAFKDDAYVANLEKMLGKDLRERSEICAESRINKFSAVCFPEQKEQLIDTLGDRYGLVFHPTPVVEILPKGCSKATGIRRMCEYLEIPHANTYAFGDSTNDLEMLSYVAHGIAMGNATVDAKAAADYITTDIHEDGIQNGLSHFGLI